MARVDDNILPENAQLGLHLDRYQEIMHLPIAAFNGLNDPDEVPVYECNKIWKQSQRDSLAQFLLQAEERREEELGYHLSPKWVTDERHQYRNPIILQHKHFIEAGIKTTTTISSGESLTLSTGGVVNDPVTITVAVTFTDTEELKVFYPGEDVEIYPSNISISGGIATIKIPRSRLVKPSLLDDREDPLQYDDDDNFLETVDIKRVHADPTNAAKLTWTPLQRVSLGKENYPDDTEETQTGVVVLEGERAVRLSIVNIWPAEYADGSWTGKKFTNTCLIPERVDVSYKSGIRYNATSELITARFAHTLMPHVPCSCPYVEQYWGDDNADTEVFTPYGSSKGAYEAWMADQRQKIGMGGAFS